MVISTRQSARQLFAVASGQSGYFTAKQAQEVGYDYSHLDYHLSTGAIERVDHGLYRLVDVPATEHDELVRWSLWSRDRQDVPQAVISHETALVLHELSELMPQRIHLTVPPKFRKAVPKGCVIHKANLDENDSEERAGFRVTTPFRTLRDIANSSVSREQFEKSLRAAVERGLIRRSERAKLLEAA